MDRENRNLPTEFARQLSIEWLFQLPKLTYAQDQTVQLGMEKTLQKLPDTFSRCGKGQTTTFSFSLILQYSIYFMYFHCLSYTTATDKEECYGFKNATALKSKA